MINDLNSFSEPEVILDSFISGKLNPVEVYEVLSLQDEEDRAEFKRLLNSELTDLTKQMESVALTQANHYIASSVTLESSKGFNTVLDSLLESNKKLLNLLTFILKQDILVYSNSENLTCYLGK